MNQEYFGDSYDLVKRFFIKVLKSENYAVYVDPMFTGNHAEMDSNYYLLIGAEPMPAECPGSGKMALFVDPDTGIGEITKKTHIKVQNLVCRLKSYTLVMVYDHSFSRSKSSIQQMRQKLSNFSRQGASGFFFDSHARFFFGSLDKNKKHLEKYRCKLLQMGIPENRLIQLPRE
jgi:hypothetical protein